MLQLPAQRPKRYALLALAVFFIGAGANHFVAPDFYVGIMPSYLTLHLELVYLSGGFEILGGLAVLIPRMRSLAGWMLIALLVAVFPANLNMALNPDQFPGLSAVALYARLPAQGFLIGWARWATRPSEEAAELAAFPDGMPR